MCVDTSSDLLAYLHALLKRSGYEVFMTRYPSEAMILVGATRPRVVIYGPGMRPSESEVEKFRQSVPNTQLLLLELGEVYRGTTPGLGATWPSKFCPKRLRTILN